MLTWMLFSTAIGAALVASAVLAEPLVRLGGRATRFLWLFVVLATLGWPAVVVVSDRSLASRDTAALRSLPAGSSETSAFVAGSVSSAQDAMTLAKRITIAVLPEPSAGLDMLLLGLWLLGSLVCVATLGVSAWRITRMRREWDRSVIAGIPVLVSHDVGPAVIGLVHHGIVVPRWVESLDDEAQRLVMLHEREHVRAGDPLLLWGAALLVSLMPWNAALWFALRRTRHAIEIDCDARVLRLEPNPRPYCSLLIDVGGRSLAGVAPVAALAEPATLLERRITAMLTSRALRIRDVAGGVLAFGLVAIACRTPHPAGIPSMSVSHPQVSRLAPEQEDISKQDSLRALEDSVVREAVAKHFPRALTGELGHHPYLWFAADRDDRVLRAAEGRQGLLTLTVSGGNRPPTTQLGNLVTWEGAAGMLAGLPASAQPGDGLFRKQLRVAGDTIDVVWVRLQAGLSPR